MRKTSKGVKRCATPMCNSKAAKGKNYCHKCVKRRWRENNPVKACFAALRDNAKRRGKDFKISFEYFVKFVVDTSYIMRKGIGREDMTIDRVEQDRGYEEDNLQVLPNYQNVQKMHYDRMMSIITPRIEHTGEDPPF